MEIDKQTLKTISVDSRLDIMKKLNHRRMLPSELSKKLGLAPSTVTEHLKKLENSGLVIKKETGHKWIYYELTEKGLNLIRPERDVKFVLVLGLGALFIFSSIAKLFYQGAQVIRSIVPPATTGGMNDMLATEEAAKELVSGAPVTSNPIDYMFWAMIILGVILIIISFVLRRR